jgi:radical SAM superfamily enzyme YgiQ (UPF0313 family)
MVREKYPKAIIIAGNTVADSIPHILLSRTEVDIAVIGEGDETIVELLQTIDRGIPLVHVRGIVYKEGPNLIATEPRPVIRDLATIPFIDYSLWDMETYINGFSPVIPFKLLPDHLRQQDIRGMCINTARGCINQCTFCYHVFRHSPYRHRPWEHVIREISQLMDRYGINYFAFFDELTFNTRKSVTDFIKIVRESGISFYWEADCRGNLFTREEDVEILRELKNLGCVRIGYSLETASPEILAMMNKRVTPEQFTFQSNLFKKAGLPIGTSLVFGFPQETPETIRRTIDCCISNGVYPSPGFLLLLPGSPMYDWAIKEGYIKDEEEYILALGDRQDLRINITGMSDDEFKDALLTELKRANKVLKAGLDEDHLLKNQSRKPLPRSFEGT